MENLVTIYSTQVLCLGLAKVAASMVSDDPNVNGVTSGFKSNPRLTAACME